MTKERATTFTGIGVGIALGALLGLLANQLSLLSLISYWDDRAPWVIGAALEPFLQSFVSIENFGDVLTSF